MIITLQWHYEKYLPPNASVLLDNMQYLIDGSLGMSGIRKTFISRRT